MHSWFVHIHADTMSVQEFFAVLPLNKILRDHQISYLEVQSNGFAFLSKFCCSGEKFLEDLLNSISVGAADRGDWWDAERLDLVHEQVIDFGPLELIEATNGFLRRLIDSNLPVHTRQEVIVDNHKNWMESKPISRISLLRAFIIRIAITLTFVKYWAKYCEVFDLDSFLLWLYYVS